MLKIIKFLSTRIIVLYGACILLVWHFVDYDKLAGNAVPQTLSRLTPPIDYFEEFIDKDDHFDRAKLMNCINYHQAVAHFFPFQRAEALGMLGFCYERLGNIDKAVASFKEAISVNPDYFWPYYDLGVIFYKRGDYDEAAGYFKQALAQDPVKNVVLLSRSKVYNDVKASLGRQKAMQHMAFKEYDYIEGLKQGRMDAYILLVCSVKKLGESALEGHLKPQVRFF